MATRVALPSRWSRGSRAEQIWLSLVAAMGLVLAASLTWLLVQSPAGAADATSAARTSASPSRSAAAAGASGSATGNAHASGGGSGSTSGAGATGSAPGTLAKGAYPTFVIARPDSSGAFDIVEQGIERRAVDHVLLTLPSAGGVRTLAGIRPVISGLHVLADGVPVPVPGGERLTADTRIPLGRKASAITLTYRLSGVAARTNPGPPGRALAVLSALSAGTSRTSPVVIRVVGPGVLNLVCPQLGLSEQLCGLRDGAELTTPSIAAASDRVVAQLDLTSASAPALGVTSG